MGMDIRFPLGLIFVILGGIMSVYGFFTRSSAMYAISEGINVNLIWGLIMLLGGALTLLASRKSSSRT